MDLITPTEHEARISTKNYDDGLVTMIDKLRDLSKARNIILKLGPDGSLIHTKKIKKNNFITDRIRTLNSSPKDIVGAGDAMLTASALSLKSGAIFKLHCRINCSSDSSWNGGNTPLVLSEI